MAEKAHILREYGDHTNSPLIMTDQGRIGVPARAGLAVASLQAAKGQAFCSLVLDCRGVPHSRTYAHADLDISVPQHIGETRTYILAALVGVEDFRAV